MTTHKHAKAITFRVTDDLAAAMDQLYARDGISPSEMLRRALTAWLAEKGVLSAARVTDRTVTLASTAGLRRRKPVR